MQHHQLVKKLALQPLTKQQIYQEYPFVDIEIIDRTLEQIQRNKSFNCNYSDGYYVVDQRKQKR